MTVLAEALAHGGRVLWDSPHRPRLLLPKALRERLEPDRETVRELLRRAAVFREQVQRFVREGKALPVLALPDHQGADGCVSCGSPVGERPYRCEVCALAVTMALEGMP